MKRFAIGALLCLTGCQSAPKARSSEPPTAESRRPAPRATTEGGEVTGGHVDVVAGPFETAERWIGEPTGGRTEIVDFLEQIRKPVVERVHRVTDTEYRALVVAADGGDEGILLTVARSGGGWQVTKQEIIDADYLWPRP